jgi:alpha-galactosidase
MKQNLFLFFTLLVGISTQAQKEAKPRPNNALYSIAFAPEKVASFTYILKKNSKPINIVLPSFEIDGKKIPTILKSLNQTGQPVKLSNGVSETVYEGAFVQNAGCTLQIKFQVSPDNPVLRFQYSLKAEPAQKLTKSLEKDNIQYLSFQSSTASIKEVRLSEFNERFHATHKTEYVLDERYFKNEETFMGPIAVVKEGQNHFLWAYEHGSQYPDRFLEFHLHANKQVSLEAMKGNYLKDQTANGFTSVWFELAGVVGNEDDLATAYRTFILKYISQNDESRKPYVFYNTWGRQERTQWAGAKYLSSMNLDWTLKEIDKAHTMGIEVYVLDAGWFLKTGDWELNKTFFPDELKQVKAKLDGYKMKMGLWFNPTVAALSSEMLAKNKQNVMTVDGEPHKPNPIWETEESVGICMVSSYWEDYANKLIELVKKYGVTYFKWDAVGQYGCNDARHFHGTEKNHVGERTQRYAFLQPLYMSKIIDKVSAVAPDAIFDFDITEDGRCVGLQYLSSGKYFIINNGPYFHNYDLAERWKSINVNGNPNIFVQPGPARGWFMRSVLDYDKWIPSVLFLTHYQPDEPRNSQTINIASLILGQNGIWGEILKTSDDGVGHINTILTKYKQIRADITAAKAITTGETGGSPEIYEKTNPLTGKGCVVIFANSGGNYTYITTHKTVKNVWFNEGVSLQQDKEGKSIIKVNFTEPSAKIIFFGVD